MLTMLDLNQTVLRVAVNNVFPFCSFEILDNDQIIFEPSIEIQYLKLLMENLNFRVKFIEMGRRFGTKTNGTWDGVVGIVNRSEVDLGMCDLSITWDRKEVVDYTHYTLVEDISILTFAPEPKRHPWAVIMPFTGMVWTCIILSILTLSAIHFYNHRNASAVNIVLKHLAIILRQPIQYAKTSKALFLMWMLLGLIFSSGYLSVIHSTLTVVEYDNLNSMEALLDVVSNDRGIVRILGKSYLANTVETATEKDSKFFYEIKGHFQRKNIKYLQNRSERIRESIRWKQKQPPLFFTTRYSIYPMLTVLKGHRQMFLWDQSIFFSNLAIALPKGSQYRYHFNKIIRHINEAGLSSHWTLQTLEYFEQQFKMNPVATVKKIYDADLPELLYRKPEQSVEPIRQLYLLDFQSIFYTFFAGIVISTIVFALELCHFCVAHLN